MNDELVDVEKLAESISHWNGLDSLRDILTDAYCLCVRQPMHIAEELGEEELNPARAAVALSSLGKKAIEKMASWVTEAQSFLSADERFLDPDDLELVSQLLIFAQRLGPRSRRDLLHFLKGANEGERSYMLLEARGASSEAVFRSRIGKYTKGEFGIE